MKEALRKFSNKQSQRTYSARSSNKSNNTSSIKQLEKRDEAVKRYQEFLYRNQKYFTKDSSSNNMNGTSEWNFPKDLSSTAASQSLTKASNAHCESSFDPKPPRGERPAAASKHRFSRRMSR